MESKSNVRLSRRRFLRTTALNATALAVPAIVGPGVLGRDDVVRVGTIGCGGRGSADLTALATVPNVHIAAVCELRDDRLAKAKKIAHKSNPRGYKDFRKMIDKEKLDGISIVVEVENHAKVVVPVLQAGLNCFTEKPLDQTVEKVDAMVRAARQANRWFQVGCQRRYIPGHREVARRVRAGKLGKVYALQGHWHFSRVPSLLDQDKGGGRLVEQAVHHLDAMSWVMGDQAPLHCVAIGAPMPNPGPNPPQHLNEIKSAVIFEFPGNVLFSYTHLFGMPGPFGDEQGGNQSGEKLWIATEKGGYDMTQATEYVRGQGGTQIGKPSTGYMDGTREEFVAFADSLRTGKLPDSNHETGRISTLMAIMGRKAMYDRTSASFTPRVVRWQDLGSTL